MGERELYVNVHLVSMGSCWKCGIQIAAPDNFVQKCRENLSPFYCANGHRAYFQDSETTRLRAELETARRERDWAQKGRDKAQRSAAAYKGNVTRIKGRIANGVCPCCNRSFENLSRHMKTKHPSFDPKDAES